ncbi:MAG TPA: GNAT family N-acetyltransferase [Candidatus Lokiarchaeia archaeon]|nr:GNAT family N-acetyltransferase [Candidatus Lokiarchaeia archaeon]
MDNIVVRTFNPTSDEQAMNEVIRKSFNSATANAYPLPPDRFVIIAEIDGKIVGHTSVRPMLLHMGNALVRTANLHMVATDPDYQRLGVGHAMMDKANEISRQERLAISILETPVPEFYALKGWEIVGNRVSLLVNRKDIEAAASQAKIDLQFRDGTLDHVDLYVDLRETVAKKCWLFAHANKDYLGGLIAPACQGSLVDFFHEIWQDEKLVGYVFGTRDSSAKEGEPLKIGVREMILETYTLDIVARVFSFLLEFDEEFEVVNAGNFVMPELETIMNSFGGTASNPGGNKDMVRVSMVKELLDELHDVIDRELVAFLKRTRKKKGEEFLLDVDGERVLLSCGSGHLQTWVINEIPEGIPAFSLTRNDLARVVMGTASPSSLVNEGKAGCTTDLVLEQLDAMFPPRPIVINYSNHLYQAYLEEMGIDHESS